MTVENEVALIKTEIWRGSIKELFFLVMAILRIIVLERNIEKRSENKWKVIENICKNGRQDGYTSINFSSR